MTLQEAKQKAADNQFLVGTKHISEFILAAVIPAPKDERLAVAWIDEITWLDVNGIKLSDIDYDAIAKRMGFSEFDVMVLPTDSFHPNRVQMTGARIYYYLT